MKKFLINLRVKNIKKKTKTAENISKILLRNALKLSTAESCTGGLISSRMTDMAGSSAYTTLNLVTYSNESKQKMLGVQEATLKKFGAVSEQCAYEMAEGLIRLTGSEVVLCTTGVAGPQCSENKPVGLLYAACGINGVISVKKFELNPGYFRKNMKFMFSEVALKFLLDTLCS